MAQVIYRANLSSAYFPFLSTLHGRSVIVGTNDNNFSRQLQSSSDLDKDIGIPQVYYCQNVLPTEQGFKAVAFQNRIAQLLAFPVSQMFLLRDDSISKKAYIAKSTTGFNAVFSESAGYQALQTTYIKAITLVPTAFGDISKKQITTAHVNGVSYLCIEGVAVVTLNFTTGLFEEVVLNGLSIPTIIGLTETNGYLIAYSKNAVAWSSLITPTDFVPSLETGAGGGNVEGARGNITTAVPTSDGFIVYTDYNAVSVLYTNNAIYPFQFSECLGSGGVGFQELVSFESTEGYNYAYTSKGLQIIKRKGAETILPALTDFLAGEVFEDFDYENNTIIQTAISLPLNKKITIVASRYFIISYGITSLTHAIVYDIVQKRIGKLKIDHVDCFEYENTDVVFGDIAKKSIAFLQSNGRISTVNFAASRSDCVAAKSTLILGKYQYVRARFVELEKVELENLQGNSVNDCSCLTSWDGKNINSTSLGISFNSSGLLSTYGFGSPVGINHSVVIKGNFELNSVILSFSVHGSTS
jgi:hypothetical protein